MLGLKMGEMLCILLLIVMVALLGALAHGIKKLGPCPECCGHDWSETEFYGVIAACTFCSNTIES